MDKEKLEQKLGEAIGLEMAAQKAVDELAAKGLLDQGAIKKGKLVRMREEANNHQTQMEALLKMLSEPDSLDSLKVHDIAQETQEKASRIMQTYLGENPDSQEAIEFLCLAEGGEVTHYEVLNVMTKGIKNKKFAAKVRSILSQEKRHLQLCTQLAKKNATVSAS